MSPIEWFYAKNNQRLGPVSPAELKQLAVRGDLKPDDLVWRSGMSDWTPARRIKGLFEGEPEAAGAVDEPATPPEAAQAIRSTFDWSAVYRRVRGRETPHHPFDYLLDFARGHFTAQFVETTASLFAACGYYGLYAALAMLAVYGVVAGMGGAGSSQVLLAVIAIPALIVLQYVAGRFLEALERLNRVTPSRLTSSAVIDCFALVSFFLGATALLGLTILAVQTERFSLIVPALAGFILCQYMASIAINPETLYVTITTTAGAGEEALGIVSFFLKIILRAVPVAFGIGAVWGTSALIYAASQVATASDKSMFGAVLDAWQAGTILFASAILPLVAYGVFLMAYLSIDILRGIISLSNLAEKPPTPDGEPGQQ
ncbi:MAG: DUF4339 domain-containing protein [Pirellulales bacterium]|nr:DUF4339 domain-containing protein [Pirellulales bacterium]